MTDVGKPALKHRMAVAGVVSIATAVVAWVKIRQNGALYDFGYFWVAARAVASGADPYAAVHPGVLYFDNWFMYTLPAALAVVPLSWLPRDIASVAFTALSMGALAFVLTSDDWQRWPILMSWPALWCVITGQWAPLVTCAVLSPTFAWAAVGKPTLGAAAFFARPSWRFVWISGVTVFISLLVMPDWPLRWWQSTQRTAEINYAVPLLVSAGGPLLALAALRWRRWDARLLLGMACVPQSMLMYDQLPLLLLARTRMEAITFSLWTAVVPLAMRFVTDTPAVDNKAATLPYLARIITWTLYLPALIVVLRRENRAT